MRKDSILQQYYLSKLPKYQTKGEVMGVDSRNIKAATTEFGKDRKCGITSANEKEYKECQKAERKEDKILQKQWEEEQKRIADQKAREWSDYINPGLNPYGEKYGRKDLTFSESFNRFKTANPQFLQTTSISGLTPEQQYAMINKMAGRSSSPTYSAVQKLKSYMGLKPTDRFTDQQLYEAINKMGGIDKYSEWWKAGWPEIKQKHGGLVKYQDRGEVQYGIPSARELANQNQSYSTDAALVARMQADAEAARLKSKMLSAAKESYIAPARKSTPQEEQMRMIRNRTYQAQNAPYTRMNAQGDLSRAIPNVSMSGQPDVRTPEARWQKGAEHMMNAMEVAGAMQGLPALYKSLSKTFAKRTPQAFISSEPVITRGPIPNPYPGTTISGRISPNVVGQDVPEELRPFIMDELNKEQYKKFMQSERYKKWLRGDNKKEGGIIEDNRGQWAHPGENTRIRSSRITMKGVNYPVLAKASNGQQQMMYPNQDYYFPGAEYVDEYPMMQKGGIRCPGNVCGPGRMDGEPTAVGNLLRNIGYGVSDLFSNIFTGKRKRPKFKTRYTAHLVENANPNFLLYGSSIPYEDWPDTWKQQPEQWTSKRISTGAPAPVESAITTTTTLFPSSEIIGAPRYNDAIVFNSPSGLNTTSLETSNVENMTYGRAEYGGPLVEYYKGKMTGPNMFQEGGELAPYEGYSVVDFLAAQNQPHDYKSRKELATSLGIKNYKGRAEQNLNLINFIKQNPNILRKSVAPQPSASIVNTPEPEPKISFTQEDYIPAPEEEAEYQYLTKKTPTPFEYIGNQQVARTPLPEILSAPKDLMINRMSDTTPLMRPQQEEPKIEVKTPPVPISKSIAFNDLLARQAYKESTFRPTVVNKKGYKGLAQLGDAAIEDYKRITGDKNINPLNPAHAVKVQKFLMDNLYNSKFINVPGRPEDVKMALTLAAYNWGRGNLSKYLDKLKNKGVDIYNSLDWIKNLPKETRDYINKVQFAKDERFNKDYERAISSPQNKQIRSLYNINNFMRGGQSNEGYYNYNYGVPEFGFGGPTRMNKFGYLVDVKANGGETDDEKAFQKFFKTLPNNLRKDTPDYNIRGYWDALGRPESFDYSQPKEADGYHHAFSRHPKTGEMLKRPQHPTFKMAIEEDRKAGYFPIVTPDGKIKTVSGKDFAGGGEYHHGYYDQYGGDISIPELPNTQKPLLQYYYNKIK